VVYESRLATLIGRLATLIGHEKRVCQVVFAPDRQTLLSAGWDGTVRLWDLTSHCSRAVLDFGIGPINCAAFAPDGMTAAVGGKDHSIVVWDIDA
jgi:WD40 repeat protein